MDSWTDLCRCCLSANCEVSLLDTEPQNVFEKFHETTTIKVREDDGLPQKLCNECYDIMISAHQFRKKCLAIDCELNLQLSERLLEQKQTYNKIIEHILPNSDGNTSDENIANNPVKLLEAIVVKKPMENDDDYYVLVIDDAKNKPEQIQNKDKIAMTKDKVPANVLATTLTSEVKYLENNQLESATVQKDKQSEDLMEYDKNKNNSSEELSCVLCRKSYESMETLIGHMLLHITTKMLIACPFCNRHVRRNALTQHIKYSHDNSSTRCNICLKLFANQEDLIGHMKTHQKRKFTCDICFKCFYQENTLQTHKLSHTHPYVCSQCDKIFKNKSTLIAHNKFKKCSKFKVKESLKRHDMSSVMNKCLAYSCLICEKSFSVQSALEKHFKSTKCGEISLKQNMLAETHKNNKVKNFKCSLCDKRFTSHAKLAMHERVHTNERPFSCQLCSLSFKTKTHLRTHQLIHTREKKYGCSICKKFFSLKGNLVSHMRSHEKT